MLNDKKVINAWCMYDWANSVYSLTITSAIFPIYYQAVATNSSGGDTIRFFGFEVVNSVLYSYSLSFSFLLVAAILPILSGIADYIGNKKLFLKCFMFLGSFSCIGLYFFTGSNIEWGIGCSILASVGYSGSLVFYDAFLSEIVTEDKRDMVSAKGYAYGYIGGVILLIINLVMVMFYEQLGLPSDGFASRLSFLTVGVWWIGFSLYALSRIPETKKDQAFSREYLVHGYKELNSVFQLLKGLPTMKYFLLAFFFYNMGVQTFMYLAATFGSKELKLQDEDLIITILLIQFVAVAGSYLFASLSKRKGNIYALRAMIFVWVLCCTFAYYVYSATEFFILASFVGLIMGGIQSLSRATFSKTMPQTTDTASFYSFYDVTFNLSTVGGTFAFGFINQITGSMRTSTVVLGVFFLIGLVFLQYVRLPHAAAKSA